MFFSVCTIVHQEFQLQHPWIFSILAMLNASTPLQGSAPREPANVSDSSEMHDNWKLLRLMSPSKSKLGSEWLGIQWPCFHCAFRWDYDYWLRPIYILSGALSDKQIRQIRPEDSVLTCCKHLPPSQQIFLAFTWKPKWVMEQLTIPMTFVKELRDSSVSYSNSYHHYIKLQNHYLQKLKRN